jgi:signal transduction histidine kinase
LVAEIKLFKLPRPECRATAAFHRLIMSTARKKKIVRKSSAKWDAAAVSQENLQRLDRLVNLGTLSAGIAHEIKNGLTAIKTFVELARIDSMVSQMLRFASPKPAAFTTVRVHDVLEHSLRLMQHQVNAKMISVRRDYRAISHNVRGDEAQLQQVFMNLLFNALEAMGTNGLLTVSTEIVNVKGARILKVQIQDNGVGVSNENLARLFEPFFTTKKNGTGLGLAISRRIIDEHHGKIEVLSEANKGSAFSILLPAA